ncbi:MAG: hypothetical protein FWF08_00740 [Oscillospiraceae bacterium]|nr:hypothetical protein [Oscillospiraceae bacterium]
MENKAETKDKKAYKVTHTKGYYRFTKIFPVHSAEYGDEEMGYNTRSAKGFEKLSGAERRFAAAAVAIVFILSYILTSAAIKISEKEPPQASIRIVEEETTVLQDDAADSEQ